ncbi:MAG TPA: hypothetical protein VLI93_10990 [Acetobacteraceae bacterium]|nr:hypothetical protein [Acetobacteraceae bacterium]
MIPFGPDPDWYEKTWLTEPPPRHPRALLAPVLVGIVCALLAVAGVTISHYAPPAATVMHFG